MGTGKRIGSVRKFVVGIGGAAFGVAAFSGCAGDGSDIGPRLPRIPDASSRVLVLDDQGRGVVGAVVTIDATSLRAITGRNGRGDFLGSPRGAVVLDVDGATGAATDGDTLGRLRIATEIPSRDVPAPVFLPDLPDSTAVTVPVGLQAGTTTLTSTGGATVTIAAGTSVGMPDAAASVELRIGELSPEHVPAPLGLPGIGFSGQGGLGGRGVYVHPMDVTFTPGVDIAVPDDMTLGTAIPRLFRLDPVNGTWQTVGTGSAGTPSAAGVVVGGGLYAWGAVAPGGSVIGRVVGTGDPVRGIADATVLVDGRRATTAGDGTFVVNGVPLRNGDGTPRNTTLEVHAGGSWLPVTATAPVSYDALTGDFAPVGDVTLDTVPCGNVRVQQVVRARADPLQPARISSLRGAVALHTISDANGQLLFEDVPAGYVGFQEARTRTRDRVYYGQSVTFLGGQRWLDSFQFLFDRAWFQGTRSNRVYACDSVGGGPLENAVVVQGLEAGAGYIGITRENGILFGERGFAGRGTVTHVSERDGRKITHAITVIGADSDHFEFPFRQVLRQPLGAFDRHGVVSGELVGANPAMQHGVRATRRLTAQEWWDEVVEGLPLQSSLPVDVDPATTHGSFRVGLPPAGGNLAAIEYTVGAGGNELQKAGLLIGFEAEEGSLVTQDVGLDLTADTTFTVVGGAATSEPAIDTGDLDVALALQLENGLVVDVARDVAGSLTVAGDDLQLTLPALTGARARDRWLAIVQGSTAAGGTTSSHASLLRLEAATLPLGVFTLPELPTITTPAPGAGVSVTGFPVQYTLPAGAMACVVELRSEVGGELALWEAFVTPAVSEFAFLELPTEADSPLVAGRTYTLTVTAWFGDVDISTPDLFGEFIAYRQTLDLIEAGITQIASRSIQVTAN